MTREEAIEIIEEIDALDSKLIDDTNKYNKMEKELDELEKNLSDLRKSLDKMGELLEECELTLCK